MLQDGAASRYISPASAEPVSTHFLCSKLDLIHCASSLFSLFTCLLVCDIMELKNVSAKDSGEKKKRMISIEVKNMSVMCKCLN